MNVTTDIMTNQDDFWSIALLPNNDTLQENEEDINQNECTSSQLFTIPSPTPNNNPLTLNIQMNNNGGVLDDVSGIPWDAALLLATYLYGTNEGRRLCVDASSCKEKEHHRAFENAHPHSFDGGILELGSGLGIVSLAVIAAVMQQSDDGVCNRIVITDRNNSEILTHLKKNVDANIMQYQRYNADNSISVEACDWVQLSTHLQSHDIDSQGSTTGFDLFPRGPFNLILGSALIYIPDHAAACADTIYYYLSDADYVSSCNTAASHSRKAIIVQLPDRSGFNTHFIPRCRELGLNVLCRKIDEKLVCRVESSLGMTIVSACDYRMYIISKNSI